MFLLSLYVIIFVLKILKVLWYWKKYNNNLTYKIILENIKFLNRILQFVYIFVNWDIHTINFQSLLASNITQCMHITNRNDSVMDIDLG